MNKRFLTGLALATAAAVVTTMPRTQAASTKTATLAVSASVAANCTIETVAVSLGAYDPLVDNATAPKDGTGKVIVGCTKGVAPKISLDFGANGGGSARRLKNAAGDLLAYELYQDEGHSTPWNNSGVGILTAPKADNKDKREFVVYGRIAGGLDVPTGTYTDSVTATVEF